MTSRQSIAALALFTVVGSASASPIYLCVDAQGRKELTDTNRRGCKPLDLPDSIPAPPRAQEGAPARARPQTAAPAPTPADFPRVDTSVQRARDDDRRGILNEELRLESQKLAELKTEFQNGEPERLGSERNYAKYQERVANLREAIGRSERNIEALKREISNIR